MPLIMLPEGTTNAQIPQLQPHELKGPSGMAAKQQLLYKIVNYQHRALIVWQEIIWHEK